MSHVHISCMIEWDIKHRDTVVSYYEDMSVQGDIGHFTRLSTLMTPGKYYVLKSLAKYLEQAER